LNPKTLGEVGSGVEFVATALKGYRFFYVDDFEGQRISPGKEIPDLASLTWCCNLFAIPPTTSEEQIRPLFAGVDRTG
jgi:hypothetical protein